MRFGEKLAEEGAWQIGADGPTCRGVVTYDPVDGLSVVLESTDSTIHDHVASNTGPVTIYGRLGRLGAVTLVDCYLTGQSWSGPIEKAFYSARRAFATRGAGSSATPLVGQAIVSFTRLAEWVSPSLRFVSTEEIDPTIVTVRVRRPNVRKVTLDDGSTIELQLTTESSTSHSVATVRTRVQFFITAATPAVFDEFVSTHVLPLEDFLTFATGRINTIDELTFRAPVLDGTDKVSAPVSVLHQTVQARTQNANWFLTFRGHGLFSLIDIAETFDQCITKWFRLYGSYRTVAELLFATIYAPAQYPEPRFLSLVQAVEGYHRQTPRFSRHRMPKAEYVRARDAAVAATPQHMHDLFAQLLAHGYEVSLRDR